MKYLPYIIPAAAILFSFIPMAAQDTGEKNDSTIIEVDDIIYRPCSELDNWHTPWELVPVDQDAVTIIGYKGDATSLTIKSPIDCDGRKFRVFGIESSAFKGVPLEELHITGNLQRIAPEAFADTRLRKIELPSTIQTIGRRAFLNAPVEVVCCSGDEPIPSSGYDYMYSVGEWIHAGYSNIFKQFEMTSRVLPGNIMSPTFDEAGYDPTIHATLYVPKAAIPDYSMLKYNTQGKEYADAGGVWGYFEKIEPLENYDPSGVESGEAVSPDAPAAVYDLCGRKVLTGATETDLRTLPKGIYIYKGRKIII